MISSIGQLLSAMGVEQRIYDLGRQIQAISQATFQRFEEQTIAYPSPHLKHAWLAIVFWSQETAENPVVWFVKLPLDEQGKLLQSERDRFVKQLLAGAGKNLQAAKSGSAFEEVLKDNPFIFTPTPEKQAFINAKIRKTLGLGDSQHIKAALDYLTGDLSQWQELPIQGLADIASNWQAHKSLINQSIPQLPDQPLTSLCVLLENESIDDALTETLSNALNASLQRDTALSPRDASRAIALIRGLSQSTNMQSRHAALKQCLNSSLRNNMEFLATVASRNQLDLFDAPLCQLYLAALAEHNQQAFDKLLQELLFTPALRAHLLTCLQQPQCPTSAKEAFKSFSQSIRRNMH